ncbi:MAG TPA: SRPBCC family protein [Candidatus Udaeobacter sp.]|nr:SRPBCC family protein [Candidatus Udaeobacter sp.]
MAKIHESIQIEATASRVWAVVAEDVTNAPKWTTNMDRVEKLDDGPPGRGTRYRYHLALPGGRKETIEVEQTTWTKPKRCAGKFIKGPVKGTWAYTYTEHKDGSTRLTYDMDFELGGMLRLATGLFAKQYGDGIHHNLERLKKYIESGKGPRAHSK